MSSLSSCSLSRCNTRSRLLIVQLTSRIHFWLVLNAAADLVGLSGELAWWASFLFKLETSARVSVRSRKLVADRFALLPGGWASNWASVLIISLSRALAGDNPVAESLNKRSFFSLNSNFWKMLLISILVFSLWRRRVVGGVPGGPKTLKLRLARLRWREKLSLACWSCFSRVTVMGEWWRTLVGFVCCLGTVRDCRVVLDFLWVVMCGGGEESEARSSEESENWRSLSTW